MPIAPCAKFKFGEVKMSLSDKIFGTYSERQIKKINKIVNKIEELAPKYSAMSNSELSGVTAVLKNRLSCITPVLNHTVTYVDGTCYQIKCGVCADMEFYGIKLDNELNAKIHHQGNTVEISTPDSKVKVYVLPTNEELMIASDTEEIVSKLAK